MIPVKNIYHMLAYAFSVLTEKAYRNIATESFDNAAELLAAILERGIAVQLKQGLHKDYVERSEPLSALRGKLEVTESLKTRAIQRRQMVCTFEEFSVNTPLNIIIKSTVGLLMRSADVTQTRKKSLKRLMQFFDDVDEVDLRNVDWHLQYNRNNQNYRMLIAICQMAVRGLLHTQESGDNRVMDFLDDQTMSRLYEKFLLEYFRKEHPTLNACPTTIDWALDDENDALLPRMHTDITLTQGDRILIIDAKYYSHNLQTRYDTLAVHSANLYQIFTYVKNMEANMRAKRDARRVSGMLLYAKTDEKTQPEAAYSMSGNRISVGTVDLNTEFSDIRRQLDAIATDSFSTWNTVSY